MRACGYPADLSPVTVHVSNIDDRNAEGGPGNIVHVGNEGSASSSEPWVLSPSSTYVYLVLALLVLVGLAQAVRPDLESNVPTNANLRKWEVFRSWNFTSFVSEKSMQSGHVAKLCEDP